MTSVGRESIMLIYLYTVKNRKFIQKILSVRVRLGQKYYILPLIRAGTLYKMINHKCLFSFFSLRIQLFKI